MTCCPSLKVTENGKHFDILSAILWFNLISCSEQRPPFAKKQAASMNGDIITDSDSDSGELYVGLTIASARCEKADN